MSLRELYQEIIVDHGKNPRHFGKLNDANHTHAGHNPLCGDKLIIYVTEKNNVIEDITFEGSGCAISVASASLMAEAVKGRTVAEAQTLFDLFHHLVTEGKEPTVSIGKLTAFAGVAEFPVRVKCATLSWHTLKATLANNPNSFNT